MFLPDGSEHTLRLPGCSSDETVSVYCVVGNRDHTLFAATTPSAIYVFLSDTQFLACVFRRSDDDIEKKGEYRFLYWRQDSSALCVTTSRNYLLIYRIETSEKQCYNLVEPKDEELRRASQELFIKAKRPKIQISLAVVARLNSVATSVVALREELFICLQNSWLHRLRWDGSTDDEYSFFLSKIAFAADQLQSKPEYITDPSIYVVDIAYAPLVGGFCSVLSDGRAALLTSPSSRFHPKHILGVWAANLKDAVCTAANHKFRTIIFGCQSGEIATYHLDDVNGALVCAYRISLRVKDGPELISRLSCVNHVECSPHGSAFAAVWSPLNNEQNEVFRPLAPVLAIFTSFGAQLWCSLESSTDCELNSEIIYNWVDWGPEGFSLWLGSNIGLSVLPLSRSIAVSNPNMEHLDRVVFVSSNKIYVSPAKDKEQSASAPHSVWNIFTVPNDYLSSNWPLRIITVDRESNQWIIAAGTRGFTHCNMSTGRWRLFGNESQERDMLVTGGLAVWKGFAVVSCYDINRDKEELRFYPFNRQLDNQFCSRHPTDSRILMLSRREDKIISFDLDERIFIYGLSLKEGGKSGFTVNVERCAEIRVCDLVPHSVCVISVQLTLLGNDASTAKFCSNIDTVLINVSGKLIMLNPIKNEVNSENTSSDEEEDHFQLSQPMLIASYVEHMWHDVAENGDSLSYDKPHLAQALWLNCGAKGMKVWMPLFLSAQRRNSIGAVESSRSFISKRIMLPFDLDIYPLVICSRDCLALGVESSPYFLRCKTSVSSIEEPSFSLYSVHRNSEVFLHHLLRQLLKRNLGVYALEIAATCTRLPYFGHVLELLLHHVLEEEATSSEPIPDPLLPRVVAFIQEFPNFLQTVAHCARKTELSLWRSLFNVTKHPRELFEMCINDGQLETAASFLIVLQNMESCVASREHAGVLLEEALMKHRWMIARDIVRFLRAIAPNDIDSPPRPETFQKPNQKVSAGRRPPHVSSKDPEETDSFVFGNFSPGIISRPRHSHSESGTGAPISHKDSSGSNPKKLSKATSSDLTFSPIMSTDSMHVYLEEILNKHASFLLEDYSIRDLGAFSAYLDFDLVSWMSSCYSTLAHIKDFGLALMRLHAQFSWPYPLASQSVVKQLTKRIEEMKTFQSCASLASLPSSSTYEDLSNSSRNELRLSVVDETSPSVTSDCLQVSPCSNNGAKEFPFASEIEKSAETPNSSSNPESERRRVSPSSSSSISNEDSDWGGLERICGEAAAKGSRESENEMRFLLDVMYKAHCAEWTFLLCLVLRDMDYLYKKVTASYLQHSAGDILDKLKTGVSQLVLWANSNCFGYRALILAFDKHLQSVGALINTTFGNDNKASINDSLNESHEKKNLGEAKTGKVPNGVLAVQANGNANEKSLPNGKLNGGIEIGDSLINGTSLRKPSLVRSWTGSMLENTFSPPEEHGRTDRNRDGNFGNGINPDLEVVSHVNIEDGGQCSVM